MAGEELRVEITSGGPDARPGGIAIQPGRPATVIARVYNDGARHRVLNLRVVGLDAAWSEGAANVLHLDAHSSAEIEFRVTLPTGFPASSYVAGLMVEPLDQNLRPVVADITLIVLDAAKVVATLDPADVRGGKRGRFRVVMKNTTNTELALGLDAAGSDPEMVVDFKTPSLILPPQGEATVDARLRGPRPFVGERRRTPFVVRIQGRTTPVSLDGSFSQRPLLASSLLRLAVIFGIIAIWIGMGVFVYSKFNNKQHDTALLNVPPRTTTTAPSGVPNGSPTTAVGTIKGKTNPPPAKPKARPADVVAAAAKKQQPAIVSGTVTGDDISGVTVAIQSTTLASEDAQGATAVNAVPTSVQIGKVYGTLIASNTAAATSVRHVTHTTDAGTFVFPPVPAPSLYLVTLTDPGFTTRKYIANVTGDGEPIKFEVPMQAGDGTMSGTVVDDAGHGVGGSTVTITNGTVTLTTRTSTTDNVGSWSIAGISTPDTFMVSATATGKGLESQEVKLDPSGSNDHVNFRLHTGVGTIDGKVTESGSNSSAGVGDVTVTVTNGDVTRSATTLTESPLAGTFSIPGLALLTPPTAYTVTVSGDGWTTQTQSVQLTTGEAFVPVLLSHDSATITGIVTRADSHGKNEVPVGIDGAGVTLASDTVTRKTTTLGIGSGLGLGTYRLDAVPPGRYVLTIDKFGFIPESVLVTAVAGQTSSAADPELVVDKGAANGQANAQIVGLVNDNVTGNPLNGAHVVMRIPKSQPDNACIPPEPTATPDPDDPTMCIVATDTAADHGYSLPATKVDKNHPGIPPGRYEITVSLPPLYETVTVPIQVPSLARGQTMSAPTVNLREAAQVTGELHSNAIFDDGTSANDFVDGTTVDLLNPNGTKADSTKVEHQSVTTTCDPGLIAPCSKTNFDFGHVQDGTYDIAPHASADFLPTATKKRVIVVVGDNPHVIVPMDRKAHLIVRPLVYDGVDLTTPLASDVDIWLDDDCNIVGGHIPGGAAKQCPNVTFPETGLPAPSAYLVPQRTAGLHTVHYRVLGYTDADLPVTLANNDTRTNSAVLTKTAAGVTIVHVQYTLDGHDTDVDHALITVTGVVGVASDGSPVKQTFQLTTADGGIATFANTGATDCNDPTAAVCTVQFLAGTATVSVADTQSPVRFDPIAPHDETIFTTVSVQVAPRPAPLAATSKIRLSTGTLPFTTTPAPTVTLTQVPSGMALSDVVASAVLDSGSNPTTYTLRWNDVVLNRGTGLIRPGTYAFTLHKSGFTDPATDFTFTALPGTSLDLGQLVLHQKAQVTLKARTPTGGTVPNARYTLDHGTDPQLSATGASQAVFAVDALPAGQTFRGFATADGYGNGVAASVPAPTDGTNADGTVQLTQLSTLTGVVRGTRGSSHSFLSGITVTVTDQRDLSLVYTGTTDTNGKFTVTGNGLTTAEGLQTGDTFKVVLSNAFGYLAPNVPVTVALPAGTTDLGFLDEVAVPTTVKGTITSSDTGGALKDVQVTLTTTLATPGSRSTMTDANGFFEFDNVVPVQWNIAFVKSGFQNDGHLIDIQVGVTPPDQDQPLVPNRNEIKGTTKGQFGSQTAALLNGVTVQLRDAFTHANVGAAQTPTGSTYDLTDIPDGNYELVFTKTGFAAKTVGGVNVGGGPPALAVDPVTLNALTHPLKVSVVSAVGSTPIDGASVSIADDGSPNNTAEAQGPQDTVGGSTTFAQVVPGKYTITVTGGGTHLNGGGPTTVPLDDTTTDILATVTIQEAKIHGVASLTDSTGTNGSDVLTVEVFAGATATGTAVDTPTLSGGGLYDSIFLAAGQYTVKFSNGAGYTTATDTFTLVSGNDKLSSKTIAKFGSIHGTVLKDPGSGAVSADQATVDVYLGAVSGTPDFQTTVTAGTGDYDLDLPPGTYSIVYSLKHFTDQTRTGVVVAADATNNRPTITLIP